MLPIDELEADILILGAGGAGLMAALHAGTRAPGLRIVIVVKGLLGQSGCTRMVQGGYNAVFHPSDSLERHFEDTVRGGGFLNDQSLAWTLVEEAPRRIVELENRVGCLFDRNPDGTIHQKPFAGQSFDRTVHKGDLTGIEIMSNLRDYVLERGFTVLEECRGVELLVSGSRIAGALVLDNRRGRFVSIAAGAVLAATGAGATMYRISSPSLEKSADGMAMAARRGAEFVDMEMMQFHPTGLLVGSSMATGGLLEEGLRGAGARLYNGLGERYMERYEPEKLERATRDVVSRASYLEIMAGRGTPGGGVLLDATHLGTERLLRSFRGMVERCRDYGFDLLRSRVEVSPSAHYHMGGLRMGLDCRTTLDGLFAAGEDAGGVHGANRLGGNGVADSIVYGARAGDSMAGFAPAARRGGDMRAQAREAAERWSAPLGRGDGEDPFALREELEDLMWERVGVVRDGAGLEAALPALDALAERAARASGAGAPSFNARWNEALDLANLIETARMVAASALLRRESRGAHYRADFPASDPAWLRNILIRVEGGGLRHELRPVEFVRLEPPDRARTKVKA